MGFSIPTWTTKWTDQSGLVSKPWYLYLTNLQNTVGSGVTPVGNGGTGLVSGTSGGVLAFTSATALASSPALGINRLVLGGGAGATPSALGSLGTTTTVLHGNAGGAPTFGSVALGTDVSGTLAAAQFPALTGDVTTPGGSLATTVNWAVPGTIGSTTPNTGVFKGTGTNDAAGAGIVGEFITATAAPGAINPGTGVSANVTSISLTAGDWDVSGTVNFTYGATTSVTNLAGGPSSVSATLPTQDNIFDFETAAQVPTGGAVGSIPTPVVRFSLAATTTIYLVVQATFTISTLTMGGTIRARRMR